MRWAVPDGAIASPGSCGPSGSSPGSAPSIACATTDSRHGGPIAPNRLQDLTVRRPDQVWVTDATGILTGQGWFYLVAVLDLCTRRVVGWAMSPSLDARLVIAALRMALLQRRPRSQAHRPLRSRQPVRQRRLPPAPRPTWPGRFHEPQRQLLRQRLHRIASGAASNTRWSIISASPPSPRPAAPSSTTSRPFITAPDSTPVLPTKARSNLNPN